nr:MAG TPA: hypothetical protein [Caudoviricetes sp.]
MDEKKISEETKQEFKLICTAIENDGQTIPVIVGGSVENNKWVNPHVLTSEAIEAVRDYLFAKVGNEDKGSGYQWKRADGRYVKLMLTVEDESADEALTDEAEVHENVGMVSQQPAEDTMYATTE